MSYDTRREVPAKDTSHWKLKLFYIELNPVSCIIGQGQGLEKDR